MQNNKPPAIDDDCEWQQHAMQKLTFHIQKSCSGYIVYGKVTMAKKEYALSHTKWMCK